MNEIRILMLIIDSPFKHKSYPSHLNCCICFINILFKYCRRCVYAAFPNPLGSREPKSTHHSLHNLKDKVSSFLSPEETGRVRPAGFYLHKQAGCILNPDYQMIQLASFRSYQQCWWFCTCKRDKGNDPKRLTRLWKRRHHSSEPMAVCGVVECVWSQPQQNSDPHLIWMEKLKRVNHSTLIFMAIYPKNVYSRRENVRNVGIGMCERGKDCWFRFWHLSKPRRTEKKGKWCEPFGKFQLNGGFGQV